MGLILIPEKTEVAEYPSWSYTGFAHFRKLLAKTINWDEWIEWFDRSSRASLMGDFIDAPPLKPSYSHSMKGNAIAVFLNHSDCEGTMSGKNLTHLREALSALVNIAPLKEDDFNKEQAQKLIGVLNICIEKNERLKWT